MMEAMEAPGPPPPVADEMNDPVSYSDLHGRPPPHTDHTCSS